MVINKIVELIAKKFKLFDIMKYVKDQNYADERIDKLETDLVLSNRRIDALEKLIKSNDTLSQKVELENHKIK